MKHLLIGLSLLVSGCGAIQEAEAPAPVIKINAKPAACSFPHSFETKENVVTALDCLETHLDNAFDSLEGKTPNEISISELRRLQEEGLLEFSITDARQWDGISGLLSLVHPQGKDAISKLEIKRFITFLRQKADFLAQAANLENQKGKYAPFKIEFYRSLTNFSEELISFISDKGSLSQEQAQALLGLARSNREGLKLDEAESRLPAVWKLKALVLASTRAEDKVQGSSLKAFLKMAIQVARESDKTYQWWETDFHPVFMPNGIGSEWARVLETTKQYFRSTPTYDLAADEMSVQVRKILPEAELADRIPDLVKASRKLLAHQGDGNRGILYGLLHLFNGAELVGEEIKAASDQFAGCTVDRCSIPMRDALSDETLKPIAMISAQDWNASSIGYTGAGALPSRRMGRLTWKVALKRLIEREVVANVFKAFDRNEDLQIPYEGEVEEDLAEATDIAYTLISIASSRNDSNESIPVFVKPSTIIKAVGLIADRWVVAGNTDGGIDVNEFYAALKVYEDITYIAHHSTLSLPVFTNEQESARRPLPQVNDHLYVIRSQFMKQMGTAYPTELPYLVSVFQHLDKTNGGAASLTEVIVPKHDKSLRLYEHARPSHTLASTDYIVREDMMAPVSILVLLDRLIVKCDKNEDELFNWQELDCVVPLVRQAGSQILNSRLIDLPAFVPDGGTLLLDFLSQPGFPETLGKLILVNGGLDENRIPLSFITFAKSQSQANVTDLARLFVKISDKTESQLKEEISVAVIAANSTAKGAWAYYIGGGDAKSKATVSGEGQWDSVTKNLITSGVIPSISERTDGILTADALSDLWENLETRYPRVAALKILLPLSMVVGARASSADSLFESKASAEESSKVAPISPANLLIVLEGVLKK